MTAGALECWGDNESGQLGNGVSGLGAYSPYAWPVVDVEGASVVTGGVSHTCAVLAGGGVACWGFNGAGGLGDGTTINSPTPVSVVGL